MDAENFGLLQSVAVGWTNEMLEQLLVKYNKDFQKALDVLLSDGPDKVKESLFSHQSANIQHNEVIDLTGDDNDSEELRRAMEMSLAGPDTQFPLRPETNQPVQKQQEVTFGPSNRAPVSDWAMTVADTSKSNAQQTTEEQQMAEALQLSLAESFKTAEQDEVKLENPLAREPTSGAPLAMYTEESGHVWAALIMTALLQVPQVSKALRIISNMEVPEDIPSNVGQLMSHAASQDLLPISFLVDPSYFKGYPTELLRLSDITSMGAPTRTLYIEVLDAIQRCLNRIEYPSPDVKMNLYTMYIRAQRRVFDMVAEKWYPPALTTPEPLEGVVRLAFAQSATYRDDIRQGLQNQAVTNEGNAILCHSFCDPRSEIVAFELANHGYGAQGPIIPDTINIGQYLEENHEAFLKGLELNRKTQVAVDALTKIRLGLTQHNGNDTAKDIKTSLHYWEHVALGRDDPARAAVIETMVSKLQGALKTLETEVQRVDADIQVLQARVAAVDSEFLPFNYRLRAIIMGSGPGTGRNNIYSYMRDLRNNDRWWKMTNNVVVTEVPKEEVFDDNTGVLLGGGPYFVIYSKDEAVELMEWKEETVSTIKKDLETWKQQGTPWVPVVDGQKDVNMQPPPYVS
ncbi:hypothetical protein CYLTODRAFT_492409 [Cylindrobasidium torrendii FP15055 ss-10]|uniref:Uncharacterized protein n=1 Tax=Cylindrobasidium torrendii FP15055 ss-10 TaxID=1314674 RepID=A0A0D7B402_9AGAR|nr:hypothetical protein CYLTODRAFT_492409 [Cylindrobasidium torrendii FP15055 ss-10]